VRVEQSANRTLYLLPEGLLLPQPAAP
jgi:hypothetical protein